MECHFIDGAANYLQGGIVPAVAESLCVIGCSHVHCGEL